MATKTHWKNMGNYDYLGAYSLEGITDSITPTILKVEKERVTAQGGKAEDCVVVYFAEAEVDGVIIKPMVFNATNCKTIEKIYGPYIEDWIGKPVTIFATTTTMGRDTVPCLRIKNTAVGENKVKKVEPTQDVKPKEEHTCVVCGKNIDTRLYNSVMKNYGIAVCSKECYEKSQEKQKQEGESK